MYYNINIFKFYVNVFKLSFVNKYVENRYVIYVCVNMY